MDRNERTVLLIGVSARWLLESTVRSGFIGLAIDRFADWDAQQAGPVLRYERFDQIPQIARALATRAKPGAILIGGGFESHLQIADELRTIADVANVPSSVALFLRNPSQWTAMFRPKEIKTPSFCLPRQTPDERKNWLVKGLCSGGGISVREWKPNDQISSGSFLQERIQGDNRSALMLFHENSFSCLGYFRQLVGIDEFGGRGFQFCGAIGPLRPAASEAEQLERIGSAIASAVQPRGLIGIDLIARGNELIPIEINPRPTATGDLWERLHSPSLVQSHLNCFGFGPQDVNAPGHSLAELAASTHAPSFVQGKAILHWPERRLLTVSEALFEYFRESHLQGWMSDIPNANSTVEFNNPIVTIYASANDEKSCYSNLLDRAAKFYERLGCEISDPSPSK